MKGKYHGRRVWRDGGLMAIPGRAPKPLPSVEQVRAQAERYRLQLARTRHLRREARAQ